MLAFFIEIDNFGICMGVDRFGINRVFFLSKSTRILVTNKTYFFRRKIIQFFFRENGKKIPLISLSHSFCQDILLIVIFPGKKIRPLWCTPLTNFILNIKTHKNVGDKLFTNIL